MRGLETSKSDDEDNEDEDTKGDPVSKDEFL